MHRYYIDRKTTSSLIECKYQFWTHTHTRMDQLNFQVLKNIISKQNKKWTLCYRTSNWIPSLLGTTLLPPHPFLLQPHFSCLWVVTWARERTKEGWIGEKLGKLGLGQRNMLCVRGWKLTCIMFCAFWAYVMAAVVRELDGSTGHQAGGAHTCLVPTRPPLALLENDTFTFCLCFITVVDSCVQHLTPCTKGKMGDWFT